MGRAKCEHGDTDRSPDPKRGCNICRRARALRYSQSDKGREKQAEWFQAAYVPALPKTHCKHGHEFTEANTYHSVKNGRPVRYCRACNARRTNRHFHQERSNPGSYTESEWLALCESFEHRCAMCGDRTKLTVDHIVPVSRGGSNGISNIQPLCKPCNSGKKDRLLTTFPPHTSLDVTT